MLASLINLTLLIAIPVMVLMTIWTVVTLGRVLFPERFVRRIRTADRLMDTRKKTALIRSRDIVEDLQRHTSHSLEEEPHQVEDVRQEFEPLFGDLWLRRN